MIIIILSVCEIDINYNKFLLHACEVQLKVTLCILTNILTQGHTLQIITNILTQGHTLQILTNVPTQGHTLLMFLFFLLIDDKKPIKFARKPFSVYIGQHTLNLCKINLTSSRRADISWERV